MFLGYFAGSDHGGLAVIGKRERLHGYQIDYAAKGLFDVRRPGADGQIERDGHAIQTGADFVKGAEKIGPFAVHLVDKRQAGHAILVGLMPDRFALGLDAFAGAENHHSAVQDAQAALDLGREIDVAGRVDEIDLNFGAGNVLGADGFHVPIEPDAGGVDGYAALLLLGIVIGYGGALIDLAHAVAEPAIEEHPLGDGGFAGIDVGDNADVAEVC